MFGKIGLLIIAEKPGFVERHALRLGKMLAMALIEFLLEACFGHPCPRLGQTGILAVIGSRF